MKPTLKKTTPKQSKPKAQVAATAPASGLKMVTLKMPPETVAEIDRQAKAAFRTRTAQILFLIDQATRANQPIGKP